MKWYSVKKYVPEEYQRLIVRVERVDKIKDSLFLTATYGLTHSQEHGLFLITGDDGMTKKIKDGKFRITHFCIPDPVEIE